MNKDIADTIDAAHVMLSKAGIKDGADLGLLQRIQILVNERDEYLTKKIHMLTAASALDVPIELKDNDGVTRKFDVTELEPKPDKLPPAPPIAKEYMKPDRREILNAAINCITKDRAGTHGDAENSFQTIAAYWQVFLTREGIITDYKSQLTAWHIAMLMALFKVARTHNNKAHDDNYVDIAGYTGCAGEIGVRTTKSSA